MKSLVEFILESYASTSLSKFISIADDNKYKDNFKYGFFILSNITNPYLYNKKQVSKGLKLANWKEEWFMTYNDKKIFNEDELCKLLHISSNEITIKTLRDVAKKKATCIFIFGEDTKNDGKLKVISAMVMDPKYGKESAEYLKKMNEIAQERANNKNDSDKLDNTWNMKRANRELKEYSQEASKEQIELLNKTVNELMKYTARGKEAKELAKSKDFTNGSKAYNDTRAIITSYLIKNQIDKLIQYFNWSEKLSNKQKEYLDEVGKKLKIN